jgi:hypothetical protein
MQCSSADLETRFGPYNGCFVGFQGMPLIPAPTYAGGVPSVEGRAFKQRLHIPPDAVFRPALAALHLLHAAEDKRGIVGGVVIKMPWVARKQPPQAMLHHLSPQGVGKVKNIFYRTYSLCGSIIVRLPTVSAH